MNSRFDMPRESDEGPVGGPVPQEDPSALDALLDHVQQARGLDFSGYRRSTIHRRVEKRLHALGLATCEEYRDHLEVDPAEYHHLLDALLINVTRFFRDPEAWTRLRDDVLPRVLDATPRDEPVRVWSAGCSAGQEPFGLAIVLAEHLGIDECRDRVKIYGTDIDHDALQQARHAVYSSDELEAVGPELRDRYFRPAPEPPRPTGGAPAASDNSAWVFRSDLRRCVIFGEHDLVSDAPISRLDLLVCRNTLMYFTADVQAHVLRRFHFALRPRGVLFLGRAEKLLGHDRPFEPIDGTHRLFSRVTGGDPPYLLDTDDQRDRAREHVMANLDLRDAMHDIGPIAKIAVGPSGHLVTANDRARSMFRLHHRDLGRPFRDLDLSYRPTELRGAIERASDRDQPIKVANVPWQAGPDDDRLLDVSITPLAADDGTPLGTVVTFLDVTERAHLQHDVEVVTQELESTQDELQAAHEELETTNEELQSTVEELETTNEELQSSNEELETLNEELQSTNDELHATNDELGARTSQLRDTNTFLNAVLTGIDRGVVVLDPELLVRVWNDRARELWGLREDEVVERNFLTLDIGLPVQELGDVLRRQLTGDHATAESTLTGHDRRGRRVSCRVTSSPLQGTVGDIRGVIMLMEVTMQGTS